MLSKEGVSKQAHPQSLHCLILVLRSLILGGCITNHKLLGDDLLTDLGIAIDILQQQLTSGTPHQERLILDD